MASLPRCIVSPYTPVPDVYMTKNPGPWPSANRLMTFSTSLAWSALLELSCEQSMRIFIFGARAETHDGLDSEPTTAVAIVSSIQCQLYHGVMFGRGMPDDLVTF